MALRLTIFRYLSFLYVCYDFSTKEHSCHVIEFVSYNQLSAKR